MVGEGGGGGLCWGKGEVNRKNHQKKTSGKNRLPSCSPASGGFCYQITKLGRKETQRRYENEAQQKNPKSTHKLFGRSVTTDFSQKGGE